jgi:hypothetical protein
LHPPGGLDSREFDAMEDMSFIKMEDELFGEDWLDCYSTKILSTENKWTDVLYAPKSRLAQMLCENSKTFDVTRRFTSS